jgi:hypothetical protein
MGAKKRKSMAKVVRFIDTLTSYRESNLNDLIDRAKQLKPFGHVKWNENVWDVTSAYEGNIRAHEVRKNKNLHFCRNQPNQAEGLYGFSDAVKALTSLRYQEGSQGAGNQKQFVDAWRYLIEILLLKPPHLQLIAYITTEDLDNACNLISESVGEGTANNLQTKMHEIANLLDTNFLVRVHLDYHYSGYKRPKNKSGLGYKKVNDPSVLLETTSNKMVPADVQQAIGKLYQIIPKSKTRHRISILAATIAVCTGRRIGEILALPANQVLFSKHNNKAYLNFFIQKRSQGNLVLFKEPVYLIPQTEELVTDCINELLTLTESARNSATEIIKSGKAHIRSSSPLKVSAEVTRKEIAESIGFAKPNGCKVWIESNNVRTDKTNKTHLYNSADILEALNREVEETLKPVVVVSNDKNLMMDDYLFISYKYELEADRTTQKHAVYPIRAGVIQDALKGRISTKESGIVCTVKSLFEEYLPSNDYQTNTHAFRHTLNTLLDEGGLSDTLQSSWFGRKNPKDTESYQHTSPEKKAIIFKQKLIDGGISGPLSATIKKMPVKKAETYLNAKIKAVHDVGPGKCTHSWSQSPCTKHLECQADCSSYHWEKDDESKLEEVKRMFTTTTISLDTANKKAKSGRGKSIDWVNHNTKKLNTLQMHLDDLGVKNFDPYEFEKKELENVEN